MIAELGERLGIGVVVVAVWLAAPGIALALVGLWIIAESYRWKT